MERFTAAPLLGGMVANCFAVGTAAQSATLAPTAGSTAAGTVSFTQNGDKVTVTAKLSGLAPGGHGFHIHETTLTADLDVIRIGGGATDTVAKSVIVHKDADDFKTQPTGNSGARVACGVIIQS